MASPPTAARRTGPFLDDRVTGEIAQAFFAEIAEVGYGRVSVDAVVRRAGVGKAAVYRRWPSKDVMAVALLSEVAVHAVALPDTGSLLDDLIAFLTDTRDAMAAPLAARIILSVVAEAQHNVALRAAMRQAVELPRRQAAAEMIVRAIARGELPDGVDTEVALDLILGPMVLRQLVREQTISDADVRRFARVLKTAIGATADQG